VAYLTINKNQLWRDIALGNAAWLLLRSVENLCVRYLLDRSAHQPRHIHRRDRRDGIELPAAVAERSAELN
jgi:hypothetical protein